jgi:hypothetical protein
MRKVRRRGGRLAYLLPEIGCAVFDDIDAVLKLFKSGFRTPAG